MNTKYLMTASAILLGLPAIVTSFMPDEILKQLGQTPTLMLVIILQLTGALYFGFALMNWMAKSSLIGGIYARPLAMGNFAHFTISAIALIKAVFNGSVSSMYMLILTVLYLLFAIAFGFVLFKSPKQHTDFEKVN